MFKTSTMQNLIINVISNNLLVDSKIVRKVFFATNRSFDKTIFVIEKATREGKSITDVLEKVK